MRAGGSILAISIMLGALIGALLGQASIGTIAGVAVGLGGLLAVWLRDRRR